MPDSKGHVSKPFDTAELIRQIAEALARVTLTRSQH